MTTRPNKPWARQAALLLTLVAVVCWPSTAHAYVDPGNGSMVIQLLLGGIGGLAVAVRVYWRRLLQHFRPKRAKPDDQAAA